jgi:hypothetical protein
MVDFFFFSLEKSKNKNKTKSFISPSPYFLNFNFYAEIGHANLIKTEKTFTGRENKLQL